MILLPILLASLTWLLILWLCNQHKFLNIFEQLALWFVSALSLFVLELFLWWIIFARLSLLWPIITFIILLSLFVYKTKKTSWYIDWVFASVKNNFIDIKKQFLSLKLRKKYIVIAIWIYVLVKIFMVFQINTHMPTFDEDAVAGRDLKTKIFTENKTLVLDKTSPEYFWTDYGRYPFAWLTDTYFLLPYWEFVNWMSNIISPLIYLLSVFLLWGIFLRKTNLFVAVLSLYVFTSLPFVFIHWFGSYRNFPSWLFLFLFVFYLIDQLFNLDKEYWDNKRILIPIILVWFLSSIIRNESVMLTLISFLSIVILYHIFKKQNIKKLKTQFRPIIPIIFAYILNKIIFSLYPTWTLLNTGWTEIGSGLISSFFTNIKEPWVLLAPFKQMFTHPDYILLFVLFTISLIVFFARYKKMKNVWLFTIVTLLILFTFMFTLYANVQSLWLLTHYAFIRYPVSIIPFLIYTMIYTIYIATSKNNEHWL